MKKQPVASTQQLSINKEYIFAVQEIDWERIQIIISGTISSEQNNKIDFIDSCTKYYLYSLNLDKYVECGHSYTADGKFSIRFNLMSIDNLSPLYKGGWYLCADVKSKKFFFGFDDELKKNINAYTRIFNYRGSRYIARPTISKANCLFLLEILLIGFNYNKKKSLRNIIHGSRLVIYNSIVQIIRMFVKKNGKRILFTSDSRSDISGNEECVYNRLIERGLDKEYTILTSFKPSIKDFRNYSEKFKIAYNLAVADFIFIDDFQPIIYTTPFAPNTEIIQLWHASGPFKTVGYSRVGKPGGPNPFNAVHKNYTKAIVSSDLAVKFYAEAFGVDESIVIPTGIPRMDVFFDEQGKEKIRKDFFEKYPALSGKEIIMFAPTFRGFGPSTAYYDNQLIDFASLAKLCRERNAVTIFKMHPFITEPIQISQEYSDVCIDLSEYREINDILMVADLLITDYSSVVFEYCTLDKPMLFFAYDLEQYVAERDFYEEFTSFVPGKIVKTFDDVINAIKTEEFEIEKVEKFKRKYFNLFDSGATDRVIDMFILKKDK